MSEKKHIDRIFQEKFKDFEAFPKDHVWENIRHELHKEDEDVKIVPLWLKYAGIAALLLLFLTAGSLFLMDSDESNIDKVVETVSGLDLNESNNNEINGSTVDNNISNKDTESGNVHVNEDELSSKSTTANENYIVETNSDKRNNKVKDQYNNQNSLNTNGEVSQYNRFAEYSNSNKLKSSKEQKSNVGVISKTNSSVASKDTMDEHTEIEYYNSKKYLADQSNLDKIEQSNNSTTSKNSSKVASSEVFNNETLQGNEMNSVNLKNTITENKTNQAIDSTTIAIENIPEKEEEKSIEEAIAENEEKNAKNEKEKLKNRWQVYANIAPVYYNSFGNGSHIDEQFVGNSKSGEVNTSYGINVGYAINEKITIRSGLSSLSVSYNTNDVIVYETISSLNSDPIQSLRNVSTSQNSSDVSLNVVSESHMAIDPNNSTELFKTNASINQSISYYEIPVEIEFQFLNKRIGFGVIGGFSTFFLNSNQVYSQYLNQEIYLGEANNIRNISFTGNLGIGLDYKFTNAFKFNLEPVFKYQFNAYENTSGSFNPYIIGVYTGFSYKF